MLLISLTQPKFLLPISGTYRHMIAYRDLCEKMKLQRNQIFLIENGQEVLFTPNKPKSERKLRLKMSTSMKYRGKNWRVTLSVTVNG